MAISKGRESVDIEFKRYIGVTPVMVKAVNPTKEDIESQQRAKVILDAGLKMLQESEQEKKWMA